MLEFPELRAVCFDTPLIDTHEHLWGPTELYAQPHDFLWTLEQDYVQRDLVSAGLDSTPNGRRVFDVTQPLDERITLWWGAWQGMRNTGYAQMLEIACRDLFDVPEISPQTVPTINQHLAEARKPGWIEACLERAKIEALVRDPFWHDHDDCPPIYHFALRIDDWTRRCLTRHALYGLEKRTGLSIHSLDEMVRAMRRDVEQALATRRVVAFKLAHAYYRPVGIGEMNHADAERSFERLVHQTAASAVSDPWADYGADSQLTWVDAAPLHDYLFHHLFAWADEWQIPVQIHVGYFEGSGNFLQKGQPLELTPIFLRYPRVRFSLFHAAYPYWREVGVLAKSFPNVFADLCWMHILSPIGARRVLDEWLDVIPANKIFAFGGDVAVPERTYAHAKMARENVYRVLVRRVREEGWSQERAAELARMVLYKNPKHFLNL